MPIFESAVISRYLYITILLTFEHALNQNKKREKYGYIDLTPYPSPNSERGVSPDEAG